ncbi:MAG: hypothetical protein ACE5HT_03910 [Gemmatimonadales bacterium]
MKYVAWAVMALGLLFAVPSTAQAQQERPAKWVRLLPNYPNPFNPGTTIPFELDRDAFETGHRPEVSLRVYNVLAQLVAVPVLEDSGEPLDGLKLEWNGTGRYTAHWDGRVMDTAQRAASGVYVYQLTVDGVKLTRRMTISN